MPSLATRLGRFFRSSDPLIVRSPGAIGVVLMEAGEREVAVMKIVREALGSSLVEAKQIVETPGARLGGFTLEAAEELRVELEESGASVRLDGP